jgi:hypothetical protein
MRNRLEGDPCKNCTIRIMRQEGCCTDAGYGTKTIINRRTGATMQVCAKLVVGDGAPYCGDYLNRNSDGSGVCAGFSCERKRRFDAGA